MIAMGKGAAIWNSGDGVWMTVEVTTRPRGDNAIGSSASLRHAGHTRRGG
jgi:hypothetical protein